MRPRLTYTNVISSIALFLVLTGGAAYAIDGPLPGQDQVGSADIINNEVQTADIKDANLTTADIRAGAVVTGKLADDAVTTAKLAPEARGASAYAYVTPGSCTGTPGECTVTQSKGISSVTREDTGLYCVTAPGIDPTTTPAAVTVDWSSTSSPEGNASAMTREGTSCPGGLGFRVMTQRQPIVTVDADGGTNNAIVAGPAADANDVAFTIVIP
jgi:hypothetical protein